MRKSTLKRLSLLLPTMVMLAGTAHKTFGLELNAYDTALGIVRAFEVGHLDVAQEAVLNLQACGVRALLLDGEEVTLDQLNRIITGLATGAGTVPAVLSREPSASASFLLEPGRRNSSNCATASPLFPNGSSA